jgi:hypothetical protein
VSSRDPPRAGRPVGERKTPGVRASPAGIDGVSVATDETAREAGERCRRSPRGRSEQWQPVTALVGGNYPHFARSTSAAGAKTAAKSEVFARHEYHQARLTSSHVFRSAEFQGSATTNNMVPAGVWRVDQAGHARL